MIKIYLGDNRVNLVSEQGAIVDTRTGKTYMDIVVSEECVQYYHDAIDDEVRDAIKLKVAEIEAYDASSSVNGFRFNGHEMWVDKATRVGLVNAVDSAILLGKDAITFGIGGVSITLPCASAKAMLAQIELYALECYNVTLAHKAKMEAMTSKAEVEGYDITRDYPNKLDL